jgi:hypothetical protein
MDGKDDGTNVRTMLEEKRKSLNKTVDSEVVLDHIACFTVDWRVFVTTIKEFDLYIRTIRKVKSDLSATPASLSCSPSLIGSYYKRVMARVCDVCKDASVMLFFDTVIVICILILPIASRFFLKKPAAALMIRWTKKP